MKKKLFLLTMIAVIFCISLCSCNTDLPETNEPPAPSMQPIEPDIETTPSEDTEPETIKPSFVEPPSEKLHTSPDGSQQILTYVQSRETASGGFLHFYKDTAGNQYYFNGAGTFVGHKQSGKDNSSKEQKSEQETKVQFKLPTPHDPPTTYTRQAPCSPEEQAVIDAAYRYAANVYGEKYMSKFTYSKMLINEATKSADVFFYIRYKERIFTECCIVTLYENKPDSSNVVISGKGIDADFDPTLLNGVEIDELEQFADQKVKEKYGSNYHSYEIENDIVVVRNNSGGFDLCVIANIQTQPDHEPYREKYYYPLS